MGARRNPRSSAVKVAVVSSLYGGYDRAYSPPEQDVPVDWIMVSDRHDSALPPWRVVFEPRPAEVSPRLASRVAKCNPWLYTDADVVIWADANIRVRSRRFVSWCLESLGNNLLCQQKLDRGNYETAVNEEIAATREIPKWDKDPVEHMVNYYVDQGYPEDYGIWWCGLYIKSVNCPSFGDQWMTEMVRWTGQDQISYSYLLWTKGLRPVTLDMTMGANISTLSGFNIPVVASQSEHFILDLHADGVR